MERYSLDQEITYYNLELIESRGGWIAVDYCPLESGTEFLTARSAVILVVAVRSWTALLVFYFTLCWCNKQETSVVLRFFKIYLHIFTLTINYFIL